MPHKVLIVSLFLIFSSGSAAGDTADLAVRLSSLVRAKGKHAHIFVYDLTDNKKIYEYKADDLVKPASVMKIISSAAILKTLGINYRFLTRFYVEGFNRKKGYIKELYVKGGGDPSFTIESLMMIVRSFKRRGISQIGRINIDGSLFAEETKPQGQRAYEAGSSALSFNFNSIAFEVCANPGGGHASVVADPYELNVGIEGSIKSIRRGRGVFSIDEIKSTAGQFNYRVGGSIGIGYGCQIIYRSVRNPSDYFARTFQKLLTTNGIMVQQPSRIFPVPPHTEPLLEWESKPLSKIVWDLNHYSNNFIAEQILYTLGLRSKRKELTREAGLREIERYLISLGFLRSDFIIKDASGLSHDDRVTARIVGTVLRDAHYDNRISAEFKASLSYGGKSGTLKSRPLDFGESVLRAKTGTLSGVSSLAGYLNRKDGRSFAFAVISSEVNSRAGAHDFENRIVKLLVNG